MYLIDIWFKNQLFTLALILHFVDKLIKRKQKYIITELQLKFHMHLRKELLLLFTAIWVAISATLKLSMK